ncbi:MAG: rod shape-determining protein MreC [Puniceicoccales bacterium]|jgi:cell shape-determining protein MreC|nr:rod shape-determining protein MreC [Puniceicoccales bacterium]
MKARKRFAENCIPVKFGKRSTIATFVPLLAVGLLLLSMPTSSKNCIAEAFKHAQAPVYAATIQWERLVNTLRTSAIPRAKLVAFCEDLLRENELLRLQLAAADEKRSANAAAEARKIGNFTVIPAKVIRRDIATWASELLINSGSADGIRAGMGVISQNRVVGRVKSVNSKTATVELLTSPQFRMVVHAAVDSEMSPIIFTGGSGNIFGKSNGTVTNVPPNFSRNGEKIALVTSELSGIFPKNIAVGVIDYPGHSEGNCSIGVILNGEALSKIREVAVLANDGD